MKPRTINIALTEAQYRALGSAIAIADGEDEVSEDLGAYRRGEAVARHNAWDKINRAWHAKGRA